jgi:Uma2 family endonuclease
MLELGYLQAVGSTRDGGRTSIGLMGRPALALVSEAEFLSLPESLDKVELIDGEVVVSPSPSFFHQEVVGRLAVLLRGWASTQPTKVTVGQAPLDIRFAPGRILQPDLFVLFDAVSLGHEGPLDRVPELCIEVLSARPNYDRFTKRVIYAEAGVRELWTIELGYFVERWTGEGLRRVTKVEDRATSELLPGLVVDLAALFRE